MMGVNFAILIVLNLSFMVLEALGVIPRGFYEGYGHLLIFSLALGFGGALISLFSSKWMAKKSMGLHMIDLQRPENDFERWYVDTVHRLAVKSNIGMPELGVYEGGANAFATGWNRNNALVAVSTGLIDNLSKDEIEAVLAHEIGHIANMDMVTQTLMMGVVNTFVIFFSRILGGIIDKAVFKNEKGNGIGYMVGTIIAELLLSVLATMLVMWFSRHREYKADAFAANLTGKKPMINALLTLSNKSAPLPGDMKAFGIVGFLGLFQTHPSIEDRVERLKGL